MGVMRRGLEKILKKISKPQPKEDSGFMKGAA
jgi:hypothetical protein